MSCDFRLFREIGEDELSTEDLYHKMLLSLEKSASLSTEMYENDCLSPAAYNNEISAIQGRFDEIKAIQKDREKLAREIEESFINQEDYYYNVDDNTEGFCFDDGKVYINVPDFDGCVFRYRNSDEGLPNFPQNVIKTCDDYLNMMKEHSHLKCDDEEYLMEYIKNNSIIAFFI